jgi:hypothetical protein
MGTASVRGAHWAELVVRQLVSRWPVRWPRSPKAVIKAARWVDDLAVGNEAVHRHLVRVCLDAASKRYDELREFLRRERRDLPPSPSDPADDLPP